MKQLDRFLEHARTPMILAIVIFLASIGLLHIFRSAEEQLQELDQAVAVAKLMADSSNDLTNFARYYVTTKDQQWKKAFDRVLQIRNGQEPDAHGTKQSFKDRVHAVGFVKAELDLILKAETLSNNLAVLEIKAFESVARGREETVWDIQQYHYTAAQLAMFGEDYNRYKTEIMTTVEQFRESVYQRLQSEYAASMYQAWLLICVMNVALLLLVLVIQHRPSKSTAKPVPRKPLRAKTPRATKTK